MSGPGGGVRHVQGERFEMDTEHGTARLEYRRAGEALRLTHTEVPEEDEGQGEGGRLVRAVLDWAREEGVEVIPSCPFVADWLREHPDYRDVVAGR